MNKTLVLAVLLLAGAEKGPAQESPSPRKVPREILCLYDSKNHTAFRHTESWAYAQLILNYLGWTCRYHDLNAPLPAEAELGETRGVLLWTNNARLPRPEEWCRWLARQSREGRPLVLFLWGPLIDAAGDRPVSPEAFQELLSSVQMECTGPLPEGTAAYEMLPHEPSLVEFERKADPVMPLEARWRSTGKENHVWLKVRRADLRDTELDLVVTGPGGGFAYAPFALYEDGRITQSQWRIDPFRFFEEAFRGKGLPRPDLSTRAGRRLYFSHVDGDGFENKLLDPDRNDELSASCLKREFLERYGLPVTVSVIARDLEKSEENQRITRDIFALKNVEPAVHTYAHPLDWAKETLSYASIPGYRFSLEKETRGAVEGVEKHALPEGRRLGVFLWSGNRNPPERAIEILDALGVDNLNADDVYFDAAHPSYSLITPAYLPVGARIQFNARSSAELLYTASWTRHYWAFRNVLETFRKTGEPRRICPINLYHHFYLVERKAGREALHDIYRWILEQPIHPVTTGEYIRILKGFLGARIAQDPEGGWVISDFGACRTVRFDDEPRMVDLSASRGIQGFVHEGGALYVSLSGASARIVLSKSRPDRPYLVEASGESSLKILEDGNLELDFSGWGPSRWRIGGLPWKTARISWTGADQEEPHETKLLVDRGEVSLQFPGTLRARFKLAPE
jgi:hypothetical protein